MAVEEGGTDMLKDKVKELTLRDIDPLDAEQWARWRAASLQTAAERIAAEEQRLRKMGIIDEDGNLATSDLPSDMLPGSKTDVET